LEGAPPHSAPTACRSRDSRPGPAAPPRRPPRATAREAESVAIITIGELVIDPARQQVTSSGQPVHLTPTEFALLRELATNRGKLLTHAHLLRRGWGHGYETQTENARVYGRRPGAKVEGAGAP